MFSRTFKAFKSSLPKRHFNPGHVTFRQFTNIPETKDAASIIPILDTFENKTASGFNDLMKQLALKGRWIQAQTVYDQIFRNHEIKANMDTFTHLMVAYMNDGKYNDAMEIYRELRNHEDRSTNTTLKDLRMNSSVYASMIDILTKAEPDTKKISNEESIYEYSVVEDHSPILSNIEGHSSTSLLTALTLLNDMRHLEIPATVQMYISMLKACAKQGDEYVLGNLHKLIRMDPNIEPSVSIINHLLEAYYAVGNATLVMDTWNMAEAIGDFDSTSISIALRTCAASDNLARANYIWRLIDDTGSKIQPEDFNRFLNCVLRHNFVDEAEMLLQEGLAKGVANETSVNILEEYQSGCVS